MVNSTEKILVKTEEVEIDGQTYLRLYFFDRASTDGRTLMFTSKVYQSSGIPQFEKELPVEPAELVPSEAVKEVIEENAI